MSASSSPISDMHRSFLDAPPATACTALPILSRLSGARRLGLDKIIAPLFYSFSDETNLPAKQHIICFVLILKSILSAPAFHSHSAPRPPVCLIRSRSSRGGAVSGVRCRDRRGMIAACQRAIWGISRNRRDGIRAEGGAADTCTWCENTRACTVTRENP